MTVWIGPSSRRAPGADHLLGRDEAAGRRAQEEFVEEGVGPEDLAVAVGVGPVQVDEGGVEGERRHGHELLRVAVGGGHRAQLGVDPQHIGSETGAGGEEGDALGGGQETQIEHALVDLHGPDAPRLAGGAEMGVEGDRIEGHEPVDGLLHEARCTEQADVGAAVGDDGEITDPGPHDGADDGHGLATRSPPAEADRHPRSQLGDHVVEGGALIPHDVHPPRY